MTMTRTALLVATGLVLGALPARAERSHPVAEVPIAPADAWRKVGERVLFLATAYDAAGSPVDAVRFTWSSSNDAVVAIDSSGFATARSAGLAIITVRAGSKSAQAP